MKLKVLVTQWSPTLCDCMDCSHQAPLSMEFSRQEYWNQVTILFSRVSSQPKDQTWVSYIADWFFTICVTREAPRELKEPWVSDLLQKERKRGGYHQATDSFCPLGGHQRPRLCPGEVNVTWRTEGASPLAAGVWRVGLGTQVCCFEAGRHNLNFAPTGIGDMDTVADWTRTGNLSLLPYFPLLFAMK